jgi:hypothetical protein
MVNFFHKLQDPVLQTTPMYQPQDPDTEDTKLIYNLEDTQDTQSIYNPNKTQGHSNHGEYKKETEIQYNHQHPSQKRKMIKLCHHKLQCGTICSHRTKIRQNHDSDESHQEDQEGTEQGGESEWNQLQALEKLCRQQREELK